MKNRKPTADGRFLRLKAVKTGPLGGRALAASAFLLNPLETIRSVPFDWRYVTRSTRVLILVAVIFSPGSHANGVLLQFMYFCLDILKIGWCKVYV